MTAFGKSGTVLQSLILPWSTSLRLEGVSPGVDRSKDDLLCPEPFFFLEKKKTLLLWLVQVLVATCRIFAASWGIFHHNTQTL